MIWVVIVKTLHQSGITEVSIMKIYLVGGAVRDKLLGREPKDFDYVVVGSSPDEMVSLGYTQVGKDFPVFLHPKTKEEYALARLDRKVGVGYTGFETDWKGVTLEEDLKRRDLTINAMAMDLETEEIIDPFGGQEDLKNGWIRHVSPAFSEDPLRVVRVARFAATLGFKVHSDTYSLMLKLYNELKTLPKERIWREMEKALKAPQPSVFFHLMTRHLRMFREYEALYRTPQNLVHHPEGNAGIHTNLVMNFAASHFNDQATTFACLCHDFGKPACFERDGTAHGHELVGVSLVEDFCEKFRVPNKYKELAVTVTLHHGRIHNVLGRDGNACSKPKTIWKILKECKAFQDSHFFLKVLNACHADSAGRGKTPEEQSRFSATPYPQKDFMWECLVAAGRVDTHAVAQAAIKSGKKGAQIGEAVRCEQIHAIRGVVNHWKKG